MEATPIKPETVDSKISPKHFPHIQLLSEESIPDIPEPWFNHLNEIAKALRLKSASTSISAYSKPAEIDEVQTQILSALRYIPDSILVVTNSKISVSASIVRNIIYDYFGIFGTGALTLAKIDKKYKLPDQEARKVINIAIHKLEAYRPVMPMGEFEGLEQRYGVFLKLADDLAIPLEAKDIKQLTIVSLRDELVRLSLEIKDLLNNTDEKYFKVKYHNTPPETIKSMLIDHYGLENIEEPCLTNGEIAKKYGITTGKLAYNLIGKAINILKKHYALFKS